MVHYRSNNVRYYDFEIRKVSLVANNCICKMTVALTLNLGGRIEKSASTGLSLQMLLPALISAVLNVNICKGITPPKLQPALNQSETALTKRCVGGAPLLVE